ncbi:MAG: threonine synthase [Proteobacteria bacterium]|nr:threonine synthase [Pseudomonadota bacterium]MBU1742585.1 threonine synthase [Pseudomonadota bacterium]
MERYPEHVRPFLIPEPAGDMVYVCLDCGQTHPTDDLLYTCPGCGGVLLIEDRDFDRLTKIPGRTWQDIFDFRRTLNHPGLRGVFNYHELVAPNVPLEDVIYLGEGHTPIIQANEALAAEVGRTFYFKNDGQNPSASFKDRGMACALSCLNHLVRSKNLGKVLAVCASTGDTSASAALYAAYLSDKVASAVLLPAGKVTPAQLGQPLAAGARVFEIPGVFDDAMKVVEELSDNYHVALLNSKNAWRIRGQETYSYEVAQWFDWDVSDKAVFVPIGNAGNITAVMAGFLTLIKLGIIDGLPRIVGVQSEHADPVYRYYLEPDEEKRVWQPVTVRPSVAQAAMIGNPVSMPRVIRLVREYNQRAGQKRVNVVQVTEQAIMDNMLLANRNGHIVCTQGGECLAGLRRAHADGVLSAGEEAVLDATAHALKFADFMQMYFDDAFDPAFGITPREELKNRPESIAPEVECPAPGRPLEDEKFRAFVEATAAMVARKLGLRKK